MDLCAMETFKCPLCCSASFDNRSSLKFHILETLQLFFCPICNQKFDSLLKFAKHIGQDVVCSVKKSPEIPVEEPQNHTTHIGQNEEIEEPEEEEIETTEYYCQSCDLQFSDFQTHLHDFHKGQEIILQEEEAIAETIDEPDENVIDKNGHLYKRKKIKLEERWLAKYKSFKGVVETNENEPQDVALTSFRCDICAMNFNTFKSMRLHQRMHKPKEIKIINNPELVLSEDSFICSICNRTFDKKFEEIHINSHGTTNNKYNCQICNRKFFTKSNLELHVKAHTNNKKFICSYCKKTFLTYDALNVHLTNECQNRPHACQFCGRRFTRPHEKVKHERIHTGEKPHVCEICGKAFRVSYCLTLHMRTHSGVRPYECKTCGKRFKSHSVFRHHQKIHLDVRQYPCPFCRKAFKTSVQLAGHKNTHLKPFSCTECNRPFGSLYAVRAHLETHKKPNNLTHECWICGALYSRWFALRDHLKEHHNQVGPPPDEQEIIIGEETLEEIPVENSKLTLM